MNISTMTFTQHRSEQPSEALGASGSGSGSGAREYAPSGIGGDKQPSEARGGSGSGSNAGGNAQSSTGDDTTVAASTA